MRSRKRPRKGTSFGGGTFAGRHDQRNQAVSGVLVSSLAIATLGLHHFGFSMALALTAAAVAVCLLTRLRPVVSVSVVGCVLFASLVWAPNGTPPTPTPFDSGYSADGAFNTSGEASEVYVLESPLLGNGRIRLKMYERNTEPLPSISRPELQQGWSTISPWTEAPAIFET